MICKYLNYYAISSFLIFSSSFIIPHSAYSFAPPEKPTPPDIIVLNMIPPGDNPEQHRRDLEEYRSEIENERKYLESLREHSEIEKNEYKEGIEEYHKEIRDYRKGIETYKNHFE